MQMTTTGHDKALIVAITGEIDHHTASTIKANIEAAYNEHKALDLLLDFSEVSFMDSSGIGMIMGRYKSLLPGGELRVFGVNAHVKKLFELSGLTQIIALHDTQADAMAERKV